MQHSTQPRAQIVRHPQGLWVATAAIPYGDGVYTIREEFDERPIRAAQTKYVASVFGPRLRENKVSVSGAPGSSESGDSLTSALAMARKASDALVNPIVRQELLAKLGTRIKTVTDFVDQLYRRSSIAPGSSGFAPIVSVAGSIGGMSPNEVMHVAIGQVLCAISGGSKEAIAAVIAQARRVPADQAAEHFMTELITHSFNTPVAHILYTIFQQYGLQKFAQVMMLGWQVMQQAQQGSR